MELHTAIRGILRMQGQDYVFDPGFVNALEDFNAFEHNLAYKNTKLSKNHGLSDVTPKSWTV